MNEEQLQQLMQQVAQKLQQGADPNEVVNALVQQGMEEEMATQIVDKIMSEIGGQAQGAEQEQAPAPSGGGTGTPTAESGVVSDGQMDPGKLLTEVVQQIGPNVLLAILESYDALGEQDRAAEKQKLQQMVNQVESQQGSAEAAEPQQQAQPSGEEALFGG